MAATAFERTRMPMVIVDAQKPDYPIVMANQAFMQLTGYSAEEIVGRNCRFLQGESTSPLAVAEIRAAVLEERMANVELLNYRKDGTTFWNQLHLSPVHDAEGNLLYFFASQLDVTAYRKVQALEAAEHRLLKEVDHRAKNVLAVVDSIVRLSRSGDAALYAAAVQHRVQALAGAHSLLADCGWQDVSLARIMHQQLAAIKSRQITFEGPDVMVPPLAVQPLVMSIHELAVNAVSHGSLSVVSGKLGIEWQRTSPHPGFRLQWEERGGPKPPSSRQSGFGSEMVAVMIEKQLQGKIQHDWSDSGLVVTITVPSAA